MTEKNLFPEALMKGGFFTFFHSVMFEMSDEALARAHDYYHDVGKADTFDIGHFESMPYLIRYPKNYEEGKKYPVIVLFHGAGSRGTDIEELKKNSYFATIVPICGGGMYWNADTKRGLRYMAMARSIAGCFPKIVSDENAFNSKTAHLLCKGKRFFVYQYNVWARQKIISFFVFFFGSFIVNDLHMLGSDQNHAVFLRPIHAALQNERQEYARHGKHGLKGIIGEFHYIICAIGRIANGLKRSLTHLQELRAHLSFSVEPKVFRIAVAVVNGQGREILRTNTIDDRIAIFLFH